MAREIPSWTIPIPSSSVGRASAVVSLFGVGHLCIGEAGMVGARWSLDRFLLLITLPLPNFCGAGEPVTAVVERGLIPWDFLPVLFSDVFLPMKMLSQLDVVRSRSVLFRTTSDREVESFDLWSKLEMECLGATGCLSLAVLRSELVDLMAASLGEDACFGEFEVVKGCAFCF